jgi:hypothetical protein
MAAFWAVRYGTGRDKSSEPVGLCESRRSMARDREGMIEPATGARGGFTTKDTEATKRKGEDCWLIANS